MNQRRPLVGVVFFHGNNISDPGSLGRNLGFVFPIATDICVPRDVPSSTSLAIDFVSLILFLHSHEGHCNSENQEKLLQETQVTNNPSKNMSHPQNGET